MSIALPAHKRREELLTSCITDPRPHTNRTILMRADPAGEGIDGTVSLPSLQLLFLFQHHFSRDFSASMTTSRQCRPFSSSFFWGPAHVRLTNILIKACCSFQCSCVSCADWCLQCDGMSDPRGPVDRTFSHDLLGRAVPAVRRASDRRQPL